LAVQAIELFAGAGGLGLGVSRAGFAPAAVVEWNKYCCDTIRENQSRGVAHVSNWPLTEGDIRAIDFRKYEEQIELVAGGPPCQPFSLGGKHLGQDDERDMWPEAVRVVRETKPKAFIFENVKGLTRATFVSYFAYIVHQLTYPEIARHENESWADHMSRLEREHTGRRGGGLTYRVVYRVLNAANYGIPQRRERVFFVGFRTDLNIEWAFPEETHSADVLLWDKYRTTNYWERHRISSHEHHAPSRLLKRAMRLPSRPNRQPWQTVRDAIGNLPDPEHEPNKSREFLNHRFQPGARAYPGHTGSPLDEPAKALKAGVHGVPGGENMLMRPDGSVRYFTIRESARLQTFPDNFAFRGSWSEAMRQLGNAVPVDLALLIANNVRDHLTTENAP